MKSQAKSDQLPAIASGLPTPSPEDPRIYQFRVRDNFCYLAVCPHTGEALVIDPGYADFLARVRAEGSVVKAIVNTHSHADHCGANAVFSRELKAPVAAFGRGDHKLFDRSVMPFGRIEAHVYHTPGHTADSVIVRIGRHLFTGDTLFIGTFGYASGPDGTREMYRTLYERLPSLDSDLITWPGHDYSIEDMEMVCGVLRSPRSDVALAAYRAARGSSRPGQVFSSLADEFFWNMAYMKESPEMVKFLHSRGIDPEADDFGRYRAIQQLVNAS